MSYATIPVIELDYQSARGAVAFVGRRNGLKLVGLPVGAPVAVRDLESGTCLGCIESRSGSKTYVRLDFDTWQPETRFYDVTLPPCTTLSTDREWEAA